MAAKDAKAAEAAWTRAIDADGSIPAAWSNRGVTRLQQDDFAGAAADIAQAADLERKQFQYASGFTLCALGNARGGLGDWAGAAEAYEEAMRDDYGGVRQLATAYLALAQWELGKPSEALSSARAVADDATAPDDIRDDMRAALAGFLHASGDDDAARSAAGAVGGAAALAARADAYARAAGGGWPPSAAKAVQDAAAALA